ADLTGEAVPARRTVVTSEAGDFQSHGALQPGVLGQVDSPHPALSEQLLDLVRTETSGQGREKPCCFDLFIHSPVPAAAFGCSRCWDKQRAAGKRPCLTTTLSSGGAG